MLLRHFLYMFVFTNPCRHPLDNLARHFLGENINKVDKLCMFPHIYFMLKDHQEPHVGTRYRRNLILQFIIYNNQWL